MVILIEFCGMHRSLIKKKSIEMPFFKNITVADVRDYILNKFPELTLDQESVLVTVNQVTATLDKRLKANDSVSFVPHIGGG